MKVSRRDRSAVTLEERYLVDADVESRREKERMISTICSIDQSSSEFSTALIHERILRPVIARIDPVLISIAHQYPHRNEKTNQLVKLKFR